MQDRLTLSADAHAVDDVRPATFLERGVVVPFTTPVLLGSRVRPNARGLEIVVPSPAGVRGFYVLPLRGTPDLCTPTLHDRLLIDMIEELAVVTPDAITRVTRAAAQEGLAGREAAAAAAEAEKALARQRLVANYRMLLLLIRRTEPAGEHAVPPEADAPLSVQRRAERAVARVAGATGLAAQAVVAAMERLTDAYQAIGFRGDPTRAPYQVQLAALEEMAEEVAHWGEMAVDPQHAGCAALIARSARLTLDAGRLILDEMVAAVEDMPALLRRWAGDAEAVLRDAARLGWLLDGWSVMIGLWRFAETTGRPATIAEMAVLVPTMPHEISRWTGDGTDEPHAAAYNLRGRFVTRMTDWRTGRLLDLVARNERIAGGVA